MVWLPFRIRIAALGMAALCVAVSAPVAFAGEPTISVRLAKINNTSLIGNGVSRFEVAPGDRLQFDFFVRDWSPEGQTAGAVQATLDPKSFTSGSAGSIYPIAYESMAAKGESNTHAVSIAHTDPRYIHFGMQKVAFIDTVNPERGYSWVSMISERTGPVSRQDGREFLLGSVQSLVSGDAAGTFTYSLVEDTAMNNIITLDREPVSGIEREPVTITVKKDPMRTWMLSSTPSWGSVDAVDPDRSPGISSLAIRFNRPVDSPGASDFQITSTEGTAPAISAVEANGRQAKLKFSGPLPSNTWTCVTHIKSGTFVKVGRMHGDADQNGHVDHLDLDHMIAELNRGGPQGLAPAQGDLNHDDRISAGDVLHLLSLIRHPMD